MRLLRSLVLAALVIVPSAALPQGDPLGPEFRVNTYTTDGQFEPSVTADAAGNFVVVWTSGDQNANGIFGQRYSQIVPVELMQFGVE